MRLTESFLDGFAFQSRTFKRRDVDSRKFATDSFNDDYAIACYRQESTSAVQMGVFCVTMSKMNVEMRTSGFCPAVSREMGSDIDHTLSNHARGSHYTCATAAIMAGFDGRWIEDSIGDRYRTIEAFGNGDMEDGTPRGCSAKYQNSKYYAARNYHDYGTETGPECSANKPCFCLKEGSPTQLFGNVISWHPYTGEGPTSANFDPHYGSANAAKIDVKTFDEEYAIACWAIANDLRPSASNYADRYSGACRVIQRTHGRLKTGAGVSPPANEFVFMNWEDDWPASITGSMGHSTGMRTSMIQVTIFDSTFALVCAHTSVNLHDCVSINCRPAWLGCAVLKRDGVTLTRENFIKIPNTNRNYAIHALSPRTALYCDQPYDSTVAQYRSSILFQGGIAVTYSGVECSLMKFNPADYTLTVSNPVAISFGRTPNTGYIHSGANNHIKIASLDETHAVICFPETYIDPSYCSGHIGCDDETQGYCWIITVDVAGNTLTKGIVSTIIDFSLGFSQIELTTMSSKTVMICYVNQ